MDKLKLRNEIDEHFKWKIEDLVANDDDFNQRYKSLEEEFKKLEKFNGSNNLGITNLYDCLKLRDEITQNVMTLYVYANLKINENSTNSFYQALSSKADGLYSMYKQSVSFIEPKILTLNEKLLLEKSQSTDLKLYKHYLSDLFRTKKHILSEDKEKLIASMFEIMETPSSIYTMINNADAKFGTILDENGKEAILTQGNYRVFIQSEDREVRKRAFKSLYKYYYDIKNTIATTYISSVKKDTINAKIRNYEKSIECSLFATNVDVEVYKNLIDTVHSFLPSMHKYIDVRAKMLGLNEVHFYDIYTPLIKDMNKEITFDEARKIILEALKPLGDDYIKMLNEAFDKRWIDIYENEGKRSGAYVWGAYGTHPFISLNYSNTLDDMFTLAHELGHAMHSHYTGANQPFIYGDYTIFLAEVASTVNEALLMQYLLNNTDDEKYKMYLTDQFLDQFRTTLLRQTMFAEFEMIVHDKVENKEAQTFDSICEIYTNLNRQYYGDKIILDEEIKYEWLRIPHFYSSFYVYQYATGYSAAIAFSKNILEDGKTKEYLEFLKSGSSNYSVEILKKAGVNMLLKTPVEEALNVFKKLVDEMEKYSKK